MSTLKVDTILKRTGTGTITLGQSGDTISIPSGATITNSGTNGGGFGISEIVTPYAARMYNASNPSTYEVYTYTFTGNEGGYGGDQIAVDSYYFPNLNLVENSNVELYAELYDANGDLVATAGSSSAPYYASTPDSWSIDCLLYTSPSPRDVEESRMPSSA